MKCIFMFYLRNLDALTTALVATSAQHACGWSLGKYLDKVGLPQGARGSGPFGSTFPNSDLLRLLQKMLVNYVWMLDLFHV